jgi:hypothetical protein
MIDWSKPVYLNNKEVYYISDSYWESGKVIVEHPNLGVLRVDRLTGKHKVYTPNGHIEYTVYNKQEPWEEAYKKIGTRMFRPSKEDFKEIFELGRSWNQKKES